VLFYEHIALYRDPLIRQVLGHDAPDPIPMGKAALRRFGADAEYWDDLQCTIERRSDGQWIVIPAPGTVNETLVNGAPLTAPRALSEGDVLAAGRSAKGISKLPLTARAS